MRVKAITAAALTLLGARAARAQCASPGAPCAGSSQIVGSCGTPGFVTTLPQTLVVTGTTMPAAGNIVGWCVALLPASSSCTNTTLTMEAYHPLGGGSYSCVGADQRTATAGATSCFTLASPIPVQAGDNLGAEAATGTCFMVGSQGSMCDTSNPSCPASFTPATKTRVPTMWVQLCVAPQAPTQLAFVGLPQTIAAGGCTAAATVQAQDSLGTASAVTSATTVSLATSSAAGGFYSDSACTVALAGPSVVIASGATSSGTFYYSDTLAPSATLTGTPASGMTALTPASGTVAITPGVATTLTLAGFPSPVTAGAAGSFTVTARDQYGNVATGYRGAVSFTSSDLQAALPAAYTFTATDNGAHTFGATLKTAGTQSITVNDTGGLSAAQNGIVVSPGAASALTLAGFPSPVTAGAAGGFTVTASDAYNNVATGYTGTLSFTSSDPQAALPASYTFTGGDAGVHAFTATLKTAGTQSLAGGDGTLSGAQSGIVVNPGPAATLAVGGVANPTSVNAVNDVAVRALDAWGNTATGYGGTVHFTSSDALATLPANYTFAPADAGAHTFTGSVIFKTAGTQSVTATDTALGAVGGTQANISVGPANTTCLTVSGVPTPQQAGSASDVTVSVDDCSGNAKTTYTGTIHFTSSDAASTLPADFTFPGGTASHTFTGGVTLRTAGTHFVRATDTVTSTLTGAQANILVNPGPVAALAVAGFPSPVTAGTAGTVTVTAKDAFGNTVTAYLGTVTLGSSDGQAALPAAYAFTAGDAGAHAFPATLETAGTQSITATGGGGETGAQANISVLPAGATTLTVAGFPASITAGVAGSFTVTAHDAYGNVAAGYTGTVAFASSDAQAVLPASYGFTAGDAGVHAFGATLATVGTQSLSAHDSAQPGIAGQQTGIVVGPGPAATLQVAGFPSPTAAGTIGNFTVTARDAWGNRATGYLGAVGFTSSDPGATLPGNYTFTSGDAGTRLFSAALTTAGTQSISAADTAAPSIAGVQGGIVVDPGPAAAFAVGGIPSPIAAGIASALSVTALDAYDNVATGYLGNVALFSSDGAASLPAPQTFTAGDAGTHVFNGVVLATAGTQSVTAADTAAPSVTGSEVGIVVQPGPPASLAVSGIPGSAAACAPYDVTVTAQDAWGNLATGYAGTVSFASSDAAATLPSSYLFTSGDAGSHTFAGGVTLRTAGTQSVTASDGALSGAESGIGVQAGAPDHLVLSGPASAQAGTPASLGAQLVDACGNAVAASASISLTANGAAALDAPAMSGWSGGGTQAIAGPTTAAGGASAVLSDLVAETVRVQGAVAGAGGATAPLDVTFVPGPPDHVRVTPAAATAVDCTSVGVALQVVDAYGNPAPGVATIGLTAGAATAAAFTATTLAGAAPGSGSVTGATDAQGAATATLTDALAEAVPLTPSAPALPSGGPAATVTFTTGPASPAKSTFAFDEGPSPLTLTAGAGQATARVRGRDACGAAVPLAAGDVALTAGPALAVGAASVAADGSVSFPVTLPTCPGSLAPLSISAALQGAPVVDGAGNPVVLQIDPTCTPPDPNSTVTLVGPATATACWTFAQANPPPAGVGATSVSLSVTPVDASGRPLGAGQYVVVKPDADRLLGSPGAYNGDGTYTVLAGSDHCDATATRHAVVSVNGVDLATAFDLLFTCAPIDPARSAVTLSPAGMPATLGTAISAAIAARDVCDLPGFDRPLAVTVAPASLATVSAPAALDPAGKAAATLDALESGGGSLAVSADGVPIGDLPISWKPGADALALTLTASPTVVSASGEVAFTARVSPAGAATVSSAYLALAWSGLRVVDGSFTRDGAPAPMLQGLAAAGPVPGLPAAPVVVTFRAAVLPGASVGKVVGHLVEKPGGAATISPEASASVQVLGGAGRRAGCSCGLDGAGLFALAGLALARRRRRRG